MTTAEVLRAARALIDTPEKWGQGFNSRRPGTCCALEALEAVAQTTGTDHHAADDALRIAVPLSGVYTTTWNDARSTTHADVLAAFDRAIAAESA